MIVISIVSLIALINSVYLTFVTLIKPSQCVVGGQCMDVLASTYSTLWGVPVSFIGATFFSFILILSLTNRSQTPLHLRSLRILLYASSVFSVYFIVVQAVILQAFCFFCTLSAVCCFGMTVYLGARYGWTVGRADWRFSPHVWRYGIGVLGVAVLLYGLPQLFLSAYHVEISPRRAVTSSVKTWSYTELTTLAGLDFVAYKSEEKTIYKQAIFKYLLREDAGRLGISVPVYYEFFVKRGLSISNATLRTDITRAARRPPGISALLTRYPTKEPAVFRKYYLTLQRELLAYYDTVFLLPEKGKVTLPHNSQGTLTIGPKTAPVHAVVFSDYLCSHCATMHESLEKLQRRYPRTLRVDYRQFPHAQPLSKTLASLAYCAHKVGEYPAFSKAIYAQQRVLTPDNLSQYIPTSLRQNPTFNTCRSSDRAQRYVTEELKVVRQLAIESTPVLFINGYIGSVSLLEETLLTQETSQ